jgi:hypothetical protein
VSRANKNTCAPCSDKQVISNGVARANNRARVFEAYGGAACRCCGEREAEFLTIDHVRGDGWEHRKTVPTSMLLSWLIREGFPEDFQVLCMNCNFAKGRRGGSGVCPHEAKRRNHEACV